MIKLLIDWEEKQGGGRREPQAGRQRSGLLGKLGRGSAETAPGLDAGTQGTTAGPPPGMRQAATACLGVIAACRPGIEEIHIATPAQRAQRRATGELQPVGRRLKGGETAGRQAHGQQREYAG